MQFPVTRMRKPAWAVVLRAAIAAMAFTSQMTVATSATLPRKVVGNLFQMGAESEDSADIAFLITTPEGHILINSGYPDAPANREQLSPSLIRRQMQELGFAYADVKILLLSHAHGDHFGGHADIQRDTGARVMVMAGDDEVVRTGVDPYVGMRVRYTSPCPVDEVLRDRSVVELGGMRLTAHHTPGHTRGATTWELKVREEGRAHRILILDSAMGYSSWLLFHSDEPDRTPDRLQGYVQAVRTLRGLAPSVDIVLGPHGARIDGATPFAQFLDRRRLDLLQATQAQMMTATDPAAWQREISAVREGVSTWPAEQQLRLQYPQIDVTPATSGHQVHELADELLSHLQSSSAGVRFQNGLTVSAFDPVTLEQAQQEARFSQGMLARLDALALDSLPHDRWLLARIMRHRLASAARAAEDYWFDFVVTPYSGGSRFNFAHSVLTAQPLKTAADREHYLRLLEAYAVMCDQVAAKTRAQASRGIRVSRPAIGGVVSLFESLQENAPHALVPAQARLTGTPESQLREFNEAVRQRVSSRVIPAYTAIAAIFDEDYQKQAPDEVGVGRSPGGREYYRRLVDRIGVGLTPEQIHEIGKRRVAELDAQMQAVREQIGFKGSREAFHEMLLADPRFLARTPQEMGERLLAQVKRMEPHLPAYFSKVPRARYGVKALDAALEAGQTFGFYSSPTPADPVGYYYYNSSDLKNRSLFAVAHLSFHELLPGHHLQLALQLENAGMHPVRRVMGSGAFIEGWAEYAASLGKEMGLYADPHDLYGQLAWESFFAVRLVVDTGMNYLDWPLAKARAYMKAHVLNSDAEIASETVRYSTDLFGQALTFRLGYEKFWELRHRAEKALGAKFDVHRFHAAALNEGAMPLEVLDAQIDWFIAQGG